MRDDNWIKIYILESGKKENREEEIINEISQESFTKIKGMSS